MSQKVASADSVALTKAAFVLLLVNKQSGRAVACREEARHGKALKGLLDRYFGK